MSLEAVADETEDFIRTLPIAFPKDRERFKVQSPELYTEIDIAPKQRVKVTGTGVVAKFRGDFIGAEATQVFVVILDDAELEPIA
jgi:hypothetical protein